MHPLICSHCGAWAETPQVKDPPASLCCAECGHCRPFQRLPLYCLTGPSGTGKSTVARLLVEPLRERFVVLEQDVLWVEGLRDPTDEHRAFRSTWLRMAASVHQAGRPVVLCGTVMPPELEPLPERALFSEVRYLALVADPESLRRRLARRPAWRQWHPERIAETLEFNDWVRESAGLLDPPVRLYDTSDEPPEATAREICRWVESDGAPV